MLHDRIYMQSLATLSELKRINHEVQLEVMAAVKQAKDDHEISVDEIAADIYRDNLEGPIRGVTVEEKLQHANLFTS